MAEPKLMITPSRLLPGWLSQQRGAIAFTTYQAGKIGLDAGGQMTVFERSFSRPMGLGTKGGRFWMSSLFQLWRFEPFLEPGETFKGFDQVFVPVTGHTTGDLDVHDIAEDAEGRPLFVATRFNCLGTLSQRGSFVEVWRPPFINRLAAEDRCHLNGLAMAEGRPAYVTAVSSSNIADGWREHRRDGGIVIDVPSGETIVGGLSMPHSPRWRNGQLWLLQAGTGEFGRVDLATGQFEPVCFLPGFARGLVITDTHAIVGLSRPRENRTFHGLALDERLARENVSPRCAICVINLKTGDLEHQIEISGVIEEVYDVAFLPGAVHPMALGFRNDEIRYFVKPHAT